jgi:hypothetical protein
MVMMVLMIVVVIVMVFMLMLMLMVVVVVMMVLMVVVMMMFMLMLMVVVVVMMVFVLMIMVVAVAVRIVALLGTVCLQSLQRSLEGILLFHGLHDLLTGQLFPGSGDNDSLGVFLPQQGHSLEQPILLHAAGAGEDDGACVFDLVVVELTEVLHIDLALGGIGYGHHAADLHIVGLSPLDSLGHVAELAHAGGLNEDPVRMVLCHDLLEGLTEVTHQGAADAAGVHLCDLDTGLLEEATVNADLAKFVLDQDDPLAAVDLLEQLFNEGGLTSPKETGENIDFRHIYTPSE